MVFAATLMGTGQILRVEICTPTYVLRKPNLQSNTCMQIFARKQLKLKARNSAWRGWRGWRGLKPIAVLSQKNIVF